MFFLQIFMLLEGSETFISAILASRVKIRPLIYDADPEILTSGLQYPHFDHFWGFSNIYIFTEYFIYIF